jgi:hypothetical protein
VRAIETIRWPLHPQPRVYDTLEGYVRRLAECYGVSYDHFCRRALGIPDVDSQARRFQAPSPDVLRRLSDGTGVPIERLAQMTWRNIWNRTMDEAHRIIATPEGRAEFEHRAAMRRLQNS